MTDNISDLLTVVFTTSPTPSSPSTELLSSVVESYRTYCAALLQCRAIVVFDTYDHITATPRLKRAQVTAQIAHDYDQYKENVKDLIVREYHHSASNPGSNPTSTPEFAQSSTCAEYGSPYHDDNSVPISIQHTSDGRITFLEPTQRLGFSLAVRSALRICATPYVWIQQHDWTLAAHIPVQTMLNVMQVAETSGDDASLPVKYICLPSVRMLSYAKQTDVLRFPELRALTESLKQSFNVSAPVFASASASVYCQHQHQQLQKHSLPLTPVFFWFDKPHVALVQHYLARVFPSRYATSRGDFIEDVIGQRARDQMKQGQWRKWACWLYYPDEGQQLCLRHLDGRRWRGKEGESKQRKIYLAQKALFDQDRDDTEAVDAAETDNGVAGACEDDRAGTDD